MSEQEELKGAEKKKWLPAVGRLLDRSQVLQKLLVIALVIAHGSGIWKSRFCRILRWRKRVKAA